MGPERMSRGEIYRRLRDRDGEPVSMNDFLNAHEEEVNLELDRYGVGSKAAREQSPEDLIETADEEKEKHERPNFVDAGAPDEYPVDQYTEQAHKISEE